MILNVIFFGDRETGKSHLVKRLSQNVFDEDIKPTITVDFNLIKVDGEGIFHFWDLSGAEQFKLTTYPYYREAHLAVFCVDLSKENDETEIEKKIQLFRQMNSFDARIIVVGTKLDAAKSEVLRRFAELQKKIDFAQAIETSAKTGEGINTLLKAIVKFSKPKSPLEKAFDNLLMTLPKIADEDKKTAIEAQVGRLRMVLLNADENDTSKEKIHAINNFVNQCEFILEEQHSDVFNTVLGLAAAIMITLCAAVVGFGIGFAIGLWAGPGALVMGIIGAAAVAVTAATTVAAVDANSNSFSGTVSGALVSCGLFKQSVEMTEIKQCSNELINCLN